MPKNSTVSPKALNDLPEAPGHATLHEAMVAAYADLPVVQRTITGQTGNRTYQYAGLACIHRTVQPILARHGIAVFQPAIQRRDPATGQLFVGCLIEIMHACGESRTDEFLLACPNETPQAMGSATTYARRYSYPFAVIEDEYDDDGRAAQPESGQNRPPSRPRSAPAASGDEPPKAISDAQLKRLWAILQKQSDGDGELAREILSQAKRDVEFPGDIKALPWTKYKAVIDYIEAWPPMDVQDPTVPHGTPEADEPPPHQDEQPELDDFDPF